MLPEDTGDWDLFCESLRRGDDEAVRKVYDRYFRDLCHIADRRLAAGLKRRLDAEDVVQSVLRTFFRRTTAGQFELPDSEQLWRLLCAVTLNKVREKARFHLRKRRGLDQEVSPRVDNAARGTPRTEPVDQQPSPAEAAQFADQFEQLLGGLDQEEQQVVNLKLQDQTNDEVAAGMGISERTVRRILKRIEGRLRQAFATA